MKLIRFINYFRLTDFTKGNYNLVNDSLDRDLDLLQRLGNDHEKYLVPKSKKITGALYFSFFSDEAVFFKQEYPHDYEQVSDGLLVPYELIKR